jgi:hypothetical protein
MQKSEFGTLGANNGPLELPDIGLLKIELLEMVIGLCGGSSRPSPKDSKSSGVSPNLCRLTSLAKSPDSGRTVASIETVAKPNEIYRRLSISAARMDATIGSRARTSRDGLR